MKKPKSNLDPGPLRILILEDNPSDAELIARELRHAKIDFSSCLVQRKNEFTRALRDFLPQVILSDFKLPQFDGSAALNIVRLHAPDIPFIFVSGSIGEERAIELLAHGASDYVFKDNLARLGPAVKRVVRDAHLKFEKKIADEERLRRVEELRILAQASDQFVQINELDEIYDYLARTLQEISGASYLLLSLYDEALQAVRPKTAIGFTSLQGIICRRFRLDPMRMFFYLKDMRPDDFSDFVSRQLRPVRDGLYGLANRKIPRQTCRAVEKLLDIDSMFSMGFSWENQLFGGVTLFFKKNTDLKNAPQIESLVNLAAVAIKRLLAEKSLRESEERFRRISGTISDISYSCRIDDHGQYSLSWMTGAAMRITGYSIEEISGMHCWGRMVVSEDFPVFKKNVIDLAPGSSASCELRLSRKNGSTVWVHSFAECSRNADQPDRLTIFGGLMDISERKRADEELRKSENKYRALITQSPDGIFLVDLQGSFLSINQAICSRLKYSEAEFLALNIRDILPEPYMDIQKARLADVLGGSAANNAAEYILRGKDGQTHYHEILSTPFYQNDKLIGFQGIARDICEKKKMELQLRESEEYHRTLVNTSPDAIIIIDGGGRITFASQKALEIFAIPPQTQILGVSIMTFSAPEEVSKVQDRLVEILSGRSFPEIREYLLLRHDRQPFWGEISSAPLRDAMGRSIGLLLICRDVSSRKRTEEHIRYQAGLLQDVSDAIIATDKNDRIQVWNKAAETIYGWNAENALGQTFHDIIKPEYRYQRREEVLDKLAQEGSWSGELLHHLRDGRQISVQSTITMLKDPTGNPAGIISVNHDISERKQTEELIRASLKEKEVLLQEIHHRVKNNLQIISGLLNMQANQVADKALNDIFCESQDRIRTIALVHEKLYQSHNLADIAFDEYLLNLGQQLLISHGIASDHISVHYELKPLSVNIEKAIPLGLIVNELFTNALKHAFPDGRRGEIRIGLHFSKKARFVGIKTESGTLYKSSLCELIVADDGIGLPSSPAPDPKKTLGMNLVSMLAKQLQAKLKVKSGPGAEFRLFFSAMPDSEAHRE